MIKFNNVYCKHQLQRSLVEFVDKQHHNFLNSKRKHQLYRNGLYLFYINILSYLYSYSENELMLLMEYKSEEWLDLFGIYWTHVVKNDSNNVYTIKYKDKNRKFISKDISNRIFTEVHNELSQNGFIKIQKGCYFKKTGYYRRRKIYVYYSKIISSIRKTCCKNLIGDKDVIKLLLGTDEYMKPENPYIQVKKKICKHENEMIERLSSKHDIRYSRATPKKFLSESFDFFQLQKKIYSENDISLSLEGVPDELVQNASQTIYNKIEKEIIKKHLLSTLTAEIVKQLENKTELTLYHEILFTNQKLKSNRSSFTRVFFIDDDYNLSYGRYYGDNLSNMPRYLKGLLHINGKLAYEVDIVSAVSQLISIHADKHVKGTDYYNVPALKQMGLSRDAIKKGLLFLQNCTEMKKVCQAIAQELRYARKNSKKYQEYKNLYSAMKDGSFVKEFYNMFPWFKKYHLNPDLQMKIILIESQIASQSIKKLYEKGIIALYNFDAIYITDIHTNISVVEDVFNEVASKVFGKEVKIDLKCKQ